MSGRAAEVPLATNSASLPALARIDETIPPPRAQPPRVAQPNAVRTQAPVAIEHEVGVSVDEAGCDPAAVLEMVLFSSSAEHRAAPTYTCATARATMRLRDAKTVAICANVASRAPRQMRHNAR